MPYKSQVLYEHLMRWEPLTVPNSEGRAWIKTFNIDRETGMRSCLIKYAPGFTQQARPSQFPADIYMLEGEMRYGDLTYNEDTYHYRPQGSSGAISTEHGCVRLHWSGHGGKGDPQTEEVFIQNTNDMTPTASYTNKGDIEKGSIRLLREDKKASVQVLMSLAFKPDMVLEGTYDVHNHQEEVYTIEGRIEDYLGDVDGHIMWLPGMYLYRAPFESAHGDVLKTHLPQRILVRRGWAGDVPEFYASAWSAGEADSREGHNLATNVPTINAKLSNVEYGE